MKLNSSRIESEDQLDTAKKPGDKDENNQQDEDCDETNGIDMSEDFDSKLQDIEKRGDDSSDDDQSDNEELDKEMGETEQGADKYVICYLHFSNRIFSSSCNLNTIEKEEEKKLEFYHINV